jgi:hypothetical protein
MKLSGWLFLVISWSSILGLVVFCFYRLVNENRNSAAAAKDAETGNDRAGMTAE